MRRSITILLLIFALLLTGCGTAGPVETAGTMPTVEPSVVAACYLETLPTVWDHTAEQTPEVLFLQELTGGRLYELSEDGSVIIPELAAALPVDVTAEYAELYNIPTGAVRSYAYRIDLNPLACWDDGMAIAADDWMAVLAEDTSIFAASKPAEETVISLAEAGYSSVAEAKNAGFTEFYLDVENFWGLNGGWRKVSDRSRLRDDAMPGELDESFISAAYLYETYLTEGADYEWMQSEFVGIRTDAAECTPGLLKTGDHQITLILREPMTAEALALKLAGYQLNTGEGRSCGPWRVVCAEAELIELEPNPSWWGEYTYTADILKIYAS